MVQAPLRELFTSIQGEGPYVGYRHLFVRFSGCNLCCRYCDTPKDAPERYRVETTPGARSFNLYANPASVGDVIRHIDRLSPKSYHAVSLTGGEPLLHPEFLFALCTALRTRGWTIYLETNGTLPDALTTLAPLVDIIAMDFKLPSATGLKSFTETHQRFLEIALQSSVFIKMVVSRKTGDDFKDTLRAAAAVTTGIPLVIQPVTPFDGVDVLALQEQALSFFSDVRVIPQTHLAMGIL